MEKRRVAHIISNIKRPQEQTLTLEAVGLTKIGRTEEHEARPSILGMINKVKHLISVEEVK